MNVSGNTIKLSLRWVNFGKYIRTTPIAKGFGNTALKVSKVILAKRRDQLIFVVPFAFQISLLKFGKDSGKEQKKIMEKADDLYNKQQFEELKEYLTDASNSNPTDDEILWRLARATYEVSKPKTNKDEQLKDVEAALALANKAIEINENNGYAHKWYAILLNKILGYRGVKEKITRAMEIKEHLEKAIKLIPDDATTYHILGIWCFSVADLTWYERKIASVIYATPPTTTYDEALGYFEQAENMQPLFYNTNLLYLGKCYIKLNQPEKAKEALLKAKDYPHENPEDQKVHEEATSLLKKLGVNS